MKSMGALEDFFREDQKRHQGEPVRVLFHWRLGTREASKALLTLRHFDVGCVVSAFSLYPSKYTFSGDFKYASQKVCADYSLKPASTAFFEEYISSLGIRYIEFRSTEGIISREILAQKDFHLLLERLSNHNQGNCGRI